MSITDDIPRRRAISTYGEGTTGTGEGTGVDSGKMPVRLEIIRYGSQEAGNHHSQVPEM